MAKNPLEKECAILQQREKSIENCNELYLAEIYGSAKGAASGRVGVVAERAEGISRKEMRSDRKLAKRRKVRSNRPA